MKHSRFNRALSRYHEVINKKWTGGLTVKETKSLNRMKRGYINRSTKADRRGFDAMQKQIGRLRRLEAEIEARIELRRKEAGHAE